MRCRSEEGIGLLYSSTFAIASLSPDFAQRIGLLSGVLDVNVVLATRTSSFTRCSRRELLEAYTNSLNMRSLGTLSPRVATFGGNRRERLHRRS
jgi:hypothetical protein